MSACLNGKKTKDNSDVCTIAVAYSVACQSEYTPLPVPDFCVQLVKKKNAIFCYFFLPLIKYQNE